MSQYCVYHHTPVNTAHLQLLYVPHTPPPCPSHPCLTCPPPSSGDRRGVSLPDPRAGLSKTFGTLRSVTSSLRSATANATGQVCALINHFLPTVSPVLLVLFVRP